jgi:hypothetical protein
MFQFLKAFRSSSKRSRSAAHRGVRPHRFQPRLEVLERRELPATIVGIDPMTHVLTVQCDNAVQHPVTVDHDNFGGGRALISVDNGAFQPFFDGQYTSILINGGVAGTVSNLWANAKPLSVMGHANLDRVNVGNGNVQGIQGTLDIENPPLWNIVNINDQGDTQFRPVTIQTVQNGAFEQVSFQGSAAMNFKCADTRSVGIYTSGQGSAVTVKSTGAFGFNGATSLFGQGLFPDSVIVGDNGSVQGIQGTLNIENTPNFTTITVDDSNDLLPHTVTLDNPPSPFAGDADAWGRIHGLAPADINYECPDTNGLTIQTGLRFVTVNVLSTCPLPGSPLTLIGNTNSTIIVGNNRRVQDIMGDLIVMNNQAAGTRIFVNDSQNTFGRQWYLSTNMNIGTVSSPGLGTITYFMPDVSALNLSGGIVGNVYCVQSTSLMTLVTINTGAFGDTVCLGDAGQTLNGIQSTVTVNDGSANDTICLVSRGGGGANYQINPNDVVDMFGFPLVTFGNIAQMWFYANMFDTFFQNQGGAFGFFVDFVNPPPC